MTDFHREHLGDLTREEVEQIIDHLRFCERLSQNVMLKIGRPDTEAGELADKLEWLLKKVERREALGALEKGQCPESVSGERCQGAKGHAGACEG